MKKIMLVLSVVGLIGMVSCGSGKEEYEEVAINFMDALSEYDFQKAGEYATEDTKKLLAFMQMMMDENPEAMKKDQPEDVEFVSSEKKGDDKAIVKFKDESGEEQEVTVVKEDGEWKVHMDKEGGMEDGGDMNNEEPVDEPDGEDAE